MRWQITNEAQGADLALINLESNKREWNNFH